VLALHAVFSFFPPGANIQAGGHLLTGLDKALRNPVSSLLLATPSSILG